VPTTRVVVKSLTDDNHFAGVPLYVNDAVTGAERLMCAADLVESRRDVLIIVGVLVRQNQARCRGDRSRAVAVNLRNLGVTTPNAHHRSTAETILSARVSAS
jgi:hypothetical protein